MSLTGIRIGSLSLICAALGVVFAQSADEHKQLAEGRILRARGRYAEAENVFTALLRESEQQNRESVFVATVLDNLAQAEQDLGNSVAAERLLTRSLAIVRDPSVEGHLGEVYLEEGRAREAEPLFRHVLEARRNAPQPDPENTAVALCDLAMVYKYRGKFSQAEALLRQALAILEENFGPDHPMLSVALCPLGSALAREGKYREALSVTERTWRILGQDPRVAEPDRINTMSTLGMLYSLTGQFREAEFYGKEAVAKAEAIYGPDHSRLGWHLANYAMILKRMGRKDEAKAVEQRSTAILARSEQANPVRHTVNVNALR